MRGKSEAAMGEQGKGFVSFEKNDRKGTNEILGERGIGAGVESDVATQANPPKAKICSYRRTYVLDCQFPKVERSPDSFPFWQ